jgi:hypothetical protein
MKLTTLIPVLTLALASSLIATQDAYAAEKPTCIPVRIDTDGSRIAVWCQNDANIYYAFKTSFNTCQGHPTDTLKMWLGLLQSALLANKPVHLYYNSPAGSCVDRTIISVGLKSS